MMLESSISCLSSSGNQATFQGLHAEDYRNPLSRSENPFRNHNVGNFRIRSRRRVVCGSSSRYESSKAGTISQSRHSHASRRGRENNTTSALSGHSHGALGSFNQGHSAYSDVEVPFWDRLKEAWRVLIGAPEFTYELETISAKVKAGMKISEECLLNLKMSCQQKQSVKDRFSRLLIRDRGFSATNLARLYNAAKGAIMQHVELEDEDLQVKAVVQRLGEVELYFKVRRLKSDLLEETYSEETDVDFQPRMEPHLLWQESLPPIEPDAEQNQDADQSILSAVVDTSTPGTNLLEEVEEVEDFSPVAIDVRQRWRRGASDRRKRGVATLE